MSVIATAVRHMMAAGVTGDALLQAIAEMENAIRAEPKPRSSGAVRQQRYRENQLNKHNKTSQGVTSDDSDETPPLSPSPLSSPHTPLLTPRPHTPPDNNTRARKGTRLPADWQPSELTGDTGDAVKIWPPGSLDRELARFRDWAASVTGKNAVKSDWQAAWRNWIRKVQDEGRYGHGCKANRASGDTSIDGRSSLARAIDEGLDWIDQSQAGVS